ncbi:hypothetical protein HDZ31DRAFT_2503, partial [Schizophyllum fasciatum]
PLQEYTVIARSVVPRHVNIRDRSVPHTFTQAPPTYYLGFIISPRLLYGLFKDAGKAAATKEATLDAFLADVKKNVGLTWGHGLQKEIINDEEHWMFYVARSPFRQAIVDLDREVRDAFRRAMRLDRDPMLIIYKHPKV